LELISLKFVVLFFCSYNSKL